MVHLPVRVEDPFGILLAGPVVAQHQIHLEAAVLCAAYDRCNRIMRCLYSVCITERQHISFRITVTLPGLIQRISAFQQHRRVFPVQTQHRHRPFDDAQAYARIRRMGKAVLFGRFLDREGMPSALEMIVGQD
ncbi:hypothetical protein D3C75_1101140 [compost metagenome]